MGVVYFSIIPTFEPSRYCKCWIVCFHYIFYIVFDFMMAVIMFLFGMWFYKSEGKAAKFLSGYNMKSADERKKYDENAMCKAYGKRMMFMSVPFIIGIIIDI